MTDHDAEEAAARRALEYLFERLAVPMNTASLFAAKLPHGEQREFWSGCCAGLEDARQLIRTVNPAQFRTDRSQSDD